MCKLDKVKFRRFLKNSGIEHKQYKNKRKKKKGKVLL